jgi:hypothetical protein
MRDPKRSSTSIPSRPQAPSSTHHGSNVPPITAVGTLSSMAASVQRFFLQPDTAETLALLRIATGAMIGYIHLIWLLDLATFFGPDALLDLNVVRALHTRATKWTYLAATDSLLVARVHEGLAMCMGGMMCIGFATRWTVPGAWFLTLMTAHRLAPCLFGLDQITIMLAMYLMLGRSGAWWSLDAWISKRLREQGLANAVWARWMGWTDDQRACWTNTVSMRLIQMHLCVIYFFGGLGKLRGWMWWDGTAMWYSAASYEYQSLDLTWIGNAPVLGSMATHATLLWELLYVALVWPRATRPWVLTMALCVHGGIALFLGMITFGTMMIVANMVFIDPSWIRWARSRWRSSSS